MRKNERARQASVEESRIPVSRLAARARSGVINIFAFTIIAISLPGISRAGEPLGDGTLVIHDWLAAGSGCPGTRMARPGATRVTLTRIDGDPDRHRVVIHLSGLVLDGADPAAPGAATFARECALRLAVGLAPGKRIVALAGHAAFDLTRSPSAGTRIAALLDLGADVLADWQLALTKGDPTRRRHVAVELETPPDARRRLAAGGCGASQLAGADLLLRTDRDRADDAVHIALSGATAVLDIRTADCN